jgi:hypothetical protein
MRFVFLFFALSLSTMTSAQEVEETLPFVDPCLEVDCPAYEAIFVGPTVEDVIRAELNNYPVLIEARELNTRGACIDKLQVIYESSFRDKLYAIPQDPHWLEIFEGRGRHIYVCDSGTLNHYWDKDNQIPTTWKMVRTSIDIYLD